MSSSSTRFSSRFTRRFRGLLALLVLAAAGCGGSEIDRSRFVSTIGPVGAIVEEVAGERVAVLLPPGASPHAYEPRPSDARGATRADLLFFGAKTLDGWASDLASGTRQSLLEMLPDSLRQRGRLEGGIDPHFWMDPLAVRSLLPGIAGVLCEQDVDACDAFHRNASTYADELTAVHDSLTVLMAPLSGSAVLTGHSFLTYFAARYDLRVVGVIEAASGSEPSPRDLRRLVDAARLQGARAVISQPQHDVRASAMLARTLGIPEVEIDPLAAVDVPSLLYLAAHRLRDTLLSLPERSQ